MTGVLQYHLQCDATITTASTAAATQVNNNGNKNNHNNSSESSGVPSITTGLVSIMMEFGYVSRMKDCIFAFAASYNITNNNSSSSQHISAGAILLYEMALLVLCSILRATISSNAIAGSECTEGQSLVLLHSFKQQQQQQRQTSRSGVSDGMIHVDDVDSAAVISTKEVLWHVMWYMHRLATLTTATTATATSNSNDSTAIDATQQVTTIAASAMAATASTTIVDLCRTVEVLLIKYGDRYIDVCTHSYGLIHSLTAILQQQHSCNERVINYDVKCSAGNLRQLMYNIIIFSHE